ncbi:MAG: hypothetical protein EXX96DRAFT_367049 [Benjaminiella poitrasii]|nr:MAG: hypothetical protein EXX96DRAFT_533422 [Benjaminiella poitrasii]KAI9470719.1 MAG: hypothetical protein EXX96DRAFT_367049 [Benjaminiella poitrasii]
MCAKVDERKLYKTDGVVRLIGLQSLELLVLETTGPYGYQDPTKVVFDSLTEMFALVCHVEDCSR